VVTLALAACSANALSNPPSTTSASTPTPAPKSHTPPAAAPAPAVGTCRQLVYSAISRYSNDDATVPCAKPHTSYTFAVQTIPSDVAVPGASIGNKSIQDAASATCRTAFNRFIGGDPATRALSRLSVTYFLPAQADYNRGARWVRCDVVALKTARELAQLPRSVAGLLDHPAALDDYGVCSQGVPGAADAALVMCTEKHSYRALVTLRLGGDAASYPGVTVAGKDGQRRCSAYIADKLGKAGGYTFSWTYPTATDWAAGQRFGYCWEQTHH
jgi:hypothetical protein